MINDWGFSFEIALRKVSLDFADDKSTLVQVIQWFGAIRKQTITWANVDPDLCRPIA